MKSLLDAFWRAAAYCLHPKVIGLSVLPLLIGAGLAIGLGWFYWEAAVSAVRATLESWALVDAGLKLVESWFGTSFRAMLAPLIVVLLAAPLIVVLSVLLVALLMVPSIVSLVARRRFPALEQRHGAGIFVSTLWSMLCTALALLALTLSMPLWFIPPLVMIVPPLIWGWLTYRVMAFDVLADHADATERRELMRRHRWQLLAIGVVSGYLGAAPSLVWALGAFTLVFAPILIGLSVWLYTLVFAFSALWFSHFLLSALSQLRAEAAVAAAAEAAQASRSDSDVIELQPTPPTPSAILPPPL
jgi:hypothetical protein